MMNWYNHMPQYDMTGVEFNQLENFHSFPQFQSFDQFNEYKLNAMNNGINNFDNFAFSPDINMALGTDFNMGMPMMGLGADMSLAFGMNPVLDMPIGIDMVCADNCRFPQSEECFEFCECCYQEEKVGFNSDYLCPLGFLRICIILALIGGSICAWAIPWDLGLFYTLDSMFWSTREGYIVVAAIALSLSIFFFIWSLLNFPNLPGIHPLFWLLFIAFWDLLMMLGMLGIGITSCVREVQVAQPDFQDAVHQGAFAAAGTFALFAVLLYIAHIAASLPTIFYLI